MTHLEAVAELSSAVNELENMTVPNVDAIQPLMEKGVAAYGIANKRISNVKAMLEELKAQDVTSK